MFPFDVVIVVRGVPQQGTPHFTINEWNGTVHFITVPNKRQSINIHRADWAVFIMPHEPYYSVDSTVYPKKYAHGFVVLCFVVVMQSFIMNSHEVFIHIHQGCFAGTGAIVRLPQCQWSKPDGYGEISQCITTTKHSKAKTVCIFLGIYCTNNTGGACYLDHHLNIIEYHHYWLRTIHTCLLSFYMIFRCCFLNIFSIFLHVFYALSEMMK